MDVQRIEGGDVVKGKTWAMVMDEVTAIQWDGRRGEGLGGLKDGRKDVGKDARKDARKDEETEALWDEVRVAVMVHG